MTKAQFEREEIEDLQGGLTDLGWWDKPNRLGNCLSCLTKDGEVIEWQDYEDDPDVLQPSWLKLMGVVWVSLFYGTNHGVTMKFGPEVRLVAWEPGRFDLTVDNPERVVTITRDEVMEGEPGVIPDVHQMLFLAAMKQAGR